MNKAELVEAISNETGLSKTKSNEVVNTLVKTISESLAKGDKVSLTGFGTWSTNDRPERKGRNPKTGEDEKIFVADAAKVLTYKQLLLLQNIARDFNRHLYDRGRPKGN